jgi:hypothetical protein
MVSTEKYAKMCLRNKYTPKSSDYYRIMFSSAGEYDTEDSYLSLFATTGSSGRVGTYHKIFLFECD